MIGVITGMTDSEFIEYCPKCGAEIYTRYADGTASCECCKCRFGVVYAETEED